MRDDLKRLLPQLNTDLDELRRTRDQALDEAAKGDNPLLAEAAREVQQGRMTMLEAVNSPAYRDEFEKAINAFAEAVREMSSEETDGQAEEEDDGVSPSATTGVRSTHGPPEEDDEAFTDSLLIDAAPSRENAAAHRWTRR